MRIIMKTKGFLFVVSYQQDLVSGLRNQKSKSVYLPKQASLSLLPFGRGGKSGHQSAV